MMDWNAEPLWLVIETMRAVTAAAAPTPPPPAPVVDERAEDKRVIWRIQKHVWRLEKKVYGKRR